jgi:repeat uncharacterized protein DUF1502
MYRILLGFMLVFAVGTGNPAWGATPYRSDADLQVEVRRGMEEILDLWRDGRYEALYERTVNSGKQTREKFVKTLAAAPLRPACCWEKIQEVKISLMGDSTATVRARLGLEGGGGTEYKTRSFKLVREEGTWCMSQKDIVSLAEGGKKKSRKRAR